jgi:hypothetical protein
MLTRLGWVKKRRMPRVVIFMDDVHGRKLDEFETMRVENRE